VAAIAARKGNATPLKGKKLRFAHHFGT